ncbi:MAG: DsbE family thiol:disulfide interchange protein [Amaricoccus sp.]|uniref:DsbE family thiol:disulfide interchange protein n=1 Tax=Amaricoccus sp. TaxID=1872485 RepID=UPI0039E5AD73
MPRGWRAALLAIPPLVFLAFAAVAFIGLRRENPQELPSALVGRETPSLDRLTALRDDPAPTDADLAGPGVKLVNFWASWCAPCRVEHPLIKALSESGVEVIGINYKDDPKAALGFLKEMGDPYTRIGADTTGRTALDWGIYGVPETFVIGPGGRVVLRFPGPLDPTTVEERIKPAVAAALGSG